MSSRFYCKIIVNFADMKYNPRLSIEENAARNQCSVATVRKYIRLNGIDRNYEGKVAKIDKVKAALKRKPEATISTIAQETRLSVNTVKKYLPYALGEKELSKIDTRKVAKVDVRATKDYYATHPSVTLDLLRVESFNHKILEPCCGGGFMAEVIKDAGYDVVASDIIDRGYGNRWIFSLQILSLTCSISSQILLIRMFCLLSRKH